MARKRNIPEPVAQAEIEETSRHPLDKYNMRFEWRDPHQMRRFAENPKNHGSIQRQALDDFMDEHGWLGVVLYNATTDTVLDGNLRVAKAVEENFDAVPTLVIEAPKEAEAEIVVLFDEIGWQAQINKSKRQVLVDRVDEKSKVLEHLLGRIDDPEIHDDNPFAMPGEVKDPDDKPLPIGGFSMVAGEQYNYVTLVFRTTFNWAAAQDLFELKPQACAFHDKPVVGLGRVVDGDDFLAWVLPILRAGERALDEEEEYDEEEEDEDEG